MLFASLLLLASPPADLPTSYTGTATVCLNKADMDTIVAYEKGGMSAEKLFRGNLKCETVCAHEVQLIKKLDEFVTTSGTHFWYWHAKGYDGTVDLYLTIFAVPENKVETTGVINLCAS